MAPARKAVFSVGLLLCLATPGVAQTVPTQNGRNDPTVTPYGGTGAESADPYQRRAYGEGSAYGSNGHIHDPQNGYGREPGFGPNAADPYHRNPYGNRLTAAPKNADPYRQNPYLRETPETPYAGVRDPSGRGATNAPDGTVYDPYGVDSRPRNDDGDPPVESNYLPNGVPRYPYSPYDGRPTYGEPDYSVPNGGGASGLN
jgi:hypothetical protein